MAYQELYIDQSEYTQRNRVYEAMRRFKPNKWDTFMAYADQGFLHSPFAFGAEYFASLEDEDPIAKEDWNDEHKLWSPNLSWHEDLTEGQALVEKRRTERLEELSTFLRNTDPWSPIALAGTIGINLGSPENFIPIAGWMTRFGKLGHVASKANFIGSMDGMVAPVVKGAGKVPLSATQKFGIRVADVAIAESIYQLAKNSFQMGRGKDFNAEETGLEMAIALGIGGVLGSFSFAKEIRSKPIMERFQNVSIRLNELRDGIHARYFDKGRYDVPEPSKEQVLNDMKTRVDNLDEDIRMTQDASKERVKSYMNSLLDDTKKLGAKIMETITCVRTSGR